MDSQTSLKRNHGLQHTVCYLLFRQTVPVSNPLTMATLLLPADFLHLHLKQHKSCWGLQPLHLGLILQRLRGLWGAVPAWITGWIYGPRNGRATLAPGAPLSIRRAKVLTAFRVCRCSHSAAASPKKAGTSTPRCPHPNLPCDNYLLDYLPKQTWTKRFV